jgi:hypothetical protein
VKLLPDTQLLLWAAGQPKRFSGRHAALAEATNFRGPALVNVSISQESDHTPQPSSARKADPPTRQQRGYYEASGVGLPDGRRLTSAQYHTTAEVMLLFPISANRAN